MTQPLILLCAGGTGGHVFPARALGEELLSRGYRVAFVVDYRGRKFLDGMTGVDIYEISAGPYNGGLKGKLSFALSLIKGYIQSHQLISKIKPSLAVGFGGYPSAPPLFAAQHQRIPTILHDSNAILGLANILLASHATKIATSHKVTKAIKENWQGKVVFTGNPIRNDIIALRDKTYPAIKDTINLLIFGGSLGAASFANIIPHSIIALSRELNLKLEITHQVREADIDTVRALYKDAGLAPDIKTFFDNIPERIEKAHLMICRGGASTVAEVTCAGRPCVFIPYPWHKDQQQLHNANAVVENGGAWVIEEKDLTPEALLNLLKEIVPNKLEAAAAFARMLGEPDAVRLLGDQVAEISPLNG